MAGAKAQSAVPQSFEQAQLDVDFFGGWAKEESAVLPHNEPPQENAKAATQRLARQLYSAPVVWSSGARHFAP